MKGEEMPAIERIAIKGTSGYCSYEDAYEDKLFITPTSIRYERKPEIESVFNAPRKWSYKTTSPEFGELFAELAKEVAAILAWEDVIFVTDIGSTTFVVTYADKSRESRDFILPSEDFEACFSIVKRMLPTCEPIPDVLE